VVRRAKYFARGKMCVVNARVQWDEALAKKNGGEGVKVQPRWGQVNGGGPEEKQGKAFVASN